MAKCLATFVILTLFFNFLNNVNAKPTLRIVNGTTADDGEFPYLVQLIVYDEFNCGGGIIGPEWILTAGHCVEDGVDSIVYGTNTLYDYGGGKPNITVKETFLHPKFTYMNGEVPIYDVGLLQLSEPITYSSVAQPIRIADDNSNIPVHQDGVLSGWGGTDGSADLPNYLQKITLQLLTDEECTKLIDDYHGADSFDPAHDFCSNDHYNGGCYGDSGSPFVINGSLYGFISWSYAPCQGIIPNTYSRVTNPEYREWIRNITNI